MLRDQLYLDIPARESVQLRSYMRPLLVAQYSPVGLDEIEGIEIVIDEIFVTME